MTEIEALRCAASGKADYATDRVLTDLGRAGMWELEQVGVERVEPYVAHGGFEVTSWPTWRSYLTDKGRARLAELGGAGV